MLKKVPSQVNLTKNERGVALILVILVVALAIIVVTALTKSAYLEARSNSVVENSIEAEYLLKSAVNFAVTLVDINPTRLMDGPQDPWAQFLTGIPIPPEMLGVNKVGLTLALEITPENSKIRLSQIYDSTSGPNTAWIPIFKLVFQQLGFDDDKEETQGFGKFIGRHFNSEELISNLIDYMDPDSISNSPPNFASGVESDAPEEFANQEIKSLSELNSIPGFTPERIRKLTPYFTLKDQPRLNINFTDPLIFQSLDPEITPQNIADIVAFRSGAQGPFKATSDLNSILGPDILGRIGPKIETSSKYFQVIAKAGYAAKTYFVKAIISRDTSGSGKTEIQSMEFY